MLEPTRYDQLVLLDPICRALVVELIARAAEAHYALMIIETWRTEHRQLWLRKQGASKVDFSDHQWTRAGQPAARACDLAPYDVYRLHGPDKLQWDAGDPVWDTFGELAEGVGLLWGGRWAFKDMGHVYVKGDAQASLYSIEGIDPIDPTST